MPTTILSRVKENTDIVKIDNNDHKEMGFRFTDENDNYRFVVMSQKDFHRLIGVLILPKE